MTPQGFRQLIDAAQVRGVTQRSHTHATLDLALARYVREARWLERIRSAA